MAKLSKGVSEEISGRDELASILADSLNKKFKDFKAAHFLDGQEETPTDLTEWVGTGSSLLDLAISNRPNGGFPVGRIVELQGMEASGKSLIMAHVLAKWLNPETNASAPAPSNEKSAISNAPTAKNVDDISSAFDSLFNS